MIVFDIRCMKVLPEVNIYFTSSLKLIGCHKHEITPTFQLVKLSFHMVTVHVFIILRSYSYWHVKSDRSTGFDSFKLSNKVKNIIIIIKNM